MTSKEALNKLCDLATPNRECLNYVIGLSGTILKDLERLELLEIENKVLQEELDNKNKKLGAFTNKNYQLEKENQEFKNDSFNLGIMISENKKLTKAIEIIKTKKVNIVVFFMCENLKEYNANYHEDYKLTQQEYDLLKEVLE